MSIRRTLSPTAAPVSPMDLASGFLGIGDRTIHAKLEREIKEYFGTKHAFLVSSRKAALFLILAGLKRLTGKKKVIIPAYTCFSVPSAVRMAGLEIVLCDIRPKTFDFEHSKLRELVNDDTLCIIPTHLFGIPSDIAKARDLCEGRRIFIVEDAAQAMGAVHDRKKLGTLGDVGFFSLGRGKNITCGSGGIIVTSSESIADSIGGFVRDLGNPPVAEYVKNIVETVFLSIFIRPNFYWLPKSLPFLRIGETRFHDTFPVYKLTGFQAGLLTGWREKLESYNRVRSRNADFFMVTSDISDRMPVHPSGFPYNRLPVYMDRKSSKDLLCEVGDILGISPMYPSSINEIPEIKECFDHMRYGSAETVADTLVTLPTHVLLNDEDKLKIREAVKNVLKQEPNREPEMRGKVECR